MITKKYSVKIYPKVIFKCEITNSFLTLRHSRSIIYYISTKKKINYDFHIVKYKKSLYYLASDSFGVSFHVGTSDLTATGAFVSG